MMHAISFGTNGWRATLDTFTVPRVRMVGQGVAAYLREEGRTAPVAIGYDARGTSRGFAEELTRVLCANGFDALLSERDGSIESADGVGIGAEITGIPGCIQPPAAKILQPPAGVGITRIDPRARTNPVLALGIAGETILMIPFALRRLGCLP